MKQTDIKSLNDVCELIIDCEHKTAPTQETGYPSIRTPNIGTGRLILESVNRVSEETYKEWTKRAIPQAEDLILAREAPVGNVAIIPKNLKVCLGQRTVLIRANKEKVNPHYLVYLLLGDEIQGMIKSISNGATVHHFNMKDIRNLELPELPLLETQGKIASVLSNYDDLIENNTRRIEILEQMAKLIYEEWFVKFRFPRHENVKIIDGVPDKWKKTNALEIMDVLSGGTPKTSVPEFWNGNIPFFTPKDSTDTPYVLVTEKSISEQGLSKCNSKLYPKDTIFITARGTVGKLNLAQVPMAMNQSCYALVGKEPLTQYFLYCALHAAIDQFKSRAVGAVFDAIVRDTFKAIPFVMPSRNLIDEFTEMVTPIFKQIDNLIMKNQNLRKTRDLLLPKLISGEIDVSDVDIRIRSEFQES